MSDPTQITPEDLAAPVAARAPGSDADADPDEAAELERHGRFARVVDISDRVRARIARGELDPLRAAGEASLARIRYWRARDRAGDMGVPREDGVLDWAALDAPPARPALVAVRAALAWRAKHGTHRPAIVVLSGGTGTGKSVALGWAVLHHDRSARMMAVDRAESFDPAQAHTAARAEWDRLVAIDLLAVDELGDDTRADRLQPLLKARWTAGRITLLAGNVTPEVFRDRYCDLRLRSRLARQQAEGQRVTFALKDDDMRAAPRGAP